jgi:hypothetical protein
MLRAAVRRHRRRRGSHAVGGVVGGITMQMLAIISVVHEGQDQEGLSVHREPTLENSPYRAVLNNDIAKLITMYSILRPTQK